MYVYQRLRDLREDSDKKQEDIALVLNISRQQYQLYESGKRELPMHHFIILAKYYTVIVCSPDEPCTLTVFDNSAIYFSPSH